METTYTKSFELSQKDEMLKYVTKVNGTMGVVGNQFVVTSKVMDAAGEIVVAGAKYVGEKGQTVVHAAGTVGSIAVDMVGGVANTLVEEGKPVLESVIDTAAKLGNTAAGGLVDLGHTTVGAFTTTAKGAKESWNSDKNKAKREELLDLLPEEVSFCGFRLSRK